MDVKALTHALLSGELLAARQIVADVQRERVSLEAIECPTDLSERELTVAAAIIEMLAERAHARPPQWTAGVGALPDIFVLDPGLEEMPRSFERAKSSGPEPLRKRNLVAPPDFLHVA